MPIQPCPHCETQTPRGLESISKGAWVNYYRCLSCGHVWTMPKDGTPVKLKDVTKDADESH
jgi:hypothetical protein